MQLAELIPGLLAARGPQPLEEGVGVERVALPCPEVHQRLELRGRGELDELGGIGQPTSATVA